MKSGARWALWVALGLAIGVSLVWEWVPLGDASARIDGLPLNGLGYAGRELPLTDGEKSIYEPARVVKRLYQVGSQKIVLVIIDGSRNRHAVHDPTYCFRGAGWDTVASRDSTVAGGSARRLTLARQGRKVEALYWISDGTVRHASSPLYWWQTTLRRLTFGRSGAEPLLVVLQPFGDEPVDWNRVLGQFPALLDI